MTLRDALAIAFVAILAASGYWLMTTGATNNDILREDVGRSILTGPLILIVGSIIMMFVFEYRWPSESPTERFRVLYIAAITSVSIPAGMMLARSDFIPSLPELTFCASVWVTYWGCRLIMTGTTKQHDEEETFYGI